MSVIDETSDGAVLHLTLQRAQRRNAMDAALVAQLLQILRRAASDPAVRAVVISGAGGGFCAGSDLGELAVSTPEARSAFERDSGLLASSMVAHPKPIVAAVHGFAIGGGLTLAAACDLVVTEADARWSLPEVPIGLFPAWGLGQVVARIGVANARRLAFGVATWDGAEAVRLGLADLAAAQALPKAREAALALAKLPPAQAAAVKRFFADTALLEAADRRANEFFMQATESAEAGVSFENFRRKAQRD